MYQRRGVPRTNGFHALVNKGTINVIAPARMTGYADDEHSILLSNGQSVKADLVILATGYAFSWVQNFDSSIRFLVRKLRAISVCMGTSWFSTATPTGGQVARVRAIPSPASDQSGQENAKWSSSIYKGIVPAKNLSQRDFPMNGAVISSYFLGDNMSPETPEAFKHAEREALWLHKRHPDLISTRPAYQLRHMSSSSLMLKAFSHPSLKTAATFGQTAGGYVSSWYAQGGKLVYLAILSVNELARATLHEERKANRGKNI
ncbi:hypothetical protein B0H16DRAFT_1463525 [Mycena metata]|uniref:Uncharacterized protein n=1 Tax=Mycena metata TaxID=1033252 RepID=A0AAD7IJV9_9AGAR|nr:hypothetical protein B0H16DRAFT_1463525 [Mycena metata]